MSFEIHPRMLNSDDVHDIVEDPIKHDVRTDDVLSITRSDVMAGSPTARISRDVLDTLHQLANVAVRARGAPARSGIIPYVRYVSLGAG